MSPSTSVIVPVLNGEEFLAEAISCLQRQGNSQLEIIVIDDGSTDATAEIARSLGTAVRYFHQSHSGLAAARNHGLRRASAEIITFLDVDDVWSDGKLELQEELLESHPDAEIVIGRLQKMVRRGKAQPFEPHGEPEPALSLCCAAIRRSVFSRVGLFDESQKQADDWDWFFRAREAGVHMHRHQEVVHYYRQHGANMTTDFEAGARSTLQMLKKSLDRRRAGGATALDLPELPSEQPGQRRANRNSAERRRSMGDEYGT